ncbi:JmjC domain-containing protein [Burkholderia sp. MSMB1835]|uniref:JmjC domain-containing protein n=1 Tax=Burkholderia sp. MSMB1835 TaxID=1637876 RepID=UPI0009E93323|nr:cupin domain-containing protein [Burkholderia sp. MSMB1835]
MSIQFSIEPSLFKNQYQEKKPLLMRSAASIENFSWRDVNEFFSRCDVESKDFKISYNGIRPKHEYVESYLDIGTLRHRLVKPVVYDLLRKGATLIANKITNEPLIYEFSRAIAQYTGRRIVSSAYAAFGTKDSYRCHWDTRDVFAVQIIGRKRWILYEPSLELPLYTQQSRDYEHLHPCPSAVYMDTVLDPGDVLYIPRGWWHNPLPLGGGTFHLALGTFPAYAIDYLSWIVAQMQNFLSARKALVHPKPDSELMGELTKDLNSLIMDPKSYAKFIDEYIGATRIDTPLAIDIFGNTQIDAISDSTSLRIATQTPHHGLANRYIIANGTKINLSAQSMILITTIIEKPGITVGGLKYHHPDLDGNKVTKLITDLCHHDIIEIMPE